MGYPMVHGVIRFKRRDSQTCGAKTRSGGRCKNTPIGQTGRCRMHGGKSYGGIASPRFKHGQYSKYPLARLVGAWDAELLAGLAPIDDDQDQNPRERA